jgi:Rrf2 family protein
MLRLSKKTMFVLEAVLDIACNARPDPVQSKDIALRQGIPQRYLEGALQHLVRAGILRGVRGPKGGYRLARERRRITVAEVVRLMEEMDDLNTGAVTSPLGRAVVQPLWRELRDDMLDRLEGVSLEDLYRQVRQSGVADSTAGKSADFDI